MSFVVVVASIVRALIHLTIKRLKDRAPIINAFLLHVIRPRRLVQSDC